MFRFAEARPDEPFEFRWGSQPPVTINKPSSLTQIVKEISHNDNHFYHDFWHYESCHNFMQELTKCASISWLQQEDHITLEAFFTGYADCVKKEVQCTKEGRATDDGVTISWLQCYKWLKEEGHSVVLNSFGVDTQRVVAPSVKDSREVLVSKFSISTSMGETPRSCQLRD
jgi:hypothetical protein